MFFKNESQSSGKKKENKSIKLFSKEKIIAKKKT